MSQKLCPDMSNARLFQSLKLGSSVNLELQHLKENLIPSAPVLESISENFTLVSFIQPIRLICWIFDAINETRNVKCLSVTGDLSWSHNQRTGATRESPERDQRRHRTPANRAGGRTSSWHRRPSVSYYQGKVGVWFWNTVFHITDRWNSSVLQHLGERKYKGDLIRDFASLGEYEPLEVLRSAKFKLWLVSCCTRFLRLSELTESLFRH